VTAVVLAGVAGVVAAILPSRRAAKFTILHAAFSG
jgi:ABC-type antimicrobial peptide transport system permease subunit